MTDYYAYITEKNAADIKAAELKKLSKTASEKDMNSKTASKTKPRPKAAPIKKELPPEAPAAKPPVVGVKASELLLNPDDPREREILFAERRFAFMQRRAQALMSANMIPKSYQQNMGNCLIALDIAERLKVGEIEVMQNLDVIHGRPAWRAKWLVARINASGLLARRLQFVWEEPGEKTVHYRITYYDSNGNKQTDEGDQKIVDRVCYAVGVMRDGQELVGPKISFQLAIEEGWYHKPGSKWSTSMSEKMFMYRAAAWWADVHMPEAGLGFMTSEEAREATFTEREVGPASMKPGFRSAQELLDEHRRNQAELDKSTLGEGAPGANSDPAAPDIDTAEEIINAMTFEDVANELRRATDEDSLFLAADLIRSVIDENEREQLGNIFDQCSAKINGHTSAETEGND